MKAEVEVIIHPYSIEKNNYLLNLLIQEFNTNKWTHFYSAVAFIRKSGNYKELLKSMISFAEKGGSIEMTFGADVFSGNVKGSDYIALENLLNKMEKYQNVKFFLYHEKNRTFHPKLYLFSSQKEKSGLLIIGSSNWSYGGFVHNIEANVLINLDLEDSEHLKCFNEIMEFFQAYWQEIE